MIMFDDLNRVVSDIRAADSLAALAETLSKAVLSLGFDCYALVQHDSQRLNLGAHAGGLHMGNFPTEWVNLLARQFYYLHDPILTALNYTATPFRWDEIESLVNMTQQQRCYMALACEYGLANGYTLPLHIPGETSAVFSFALGNGRPMPEDNLPSAHHIAAYAYQRAREIRPAPAMMNDADELTDLQCQVLVQAAKGRNRAMTSRAIGLSQGQVDAATRAARRTFGVATTTEAVVHALYNHRICFADIVDG